MSGQRASNKRALSQTQLRASVLTTLLPTAVAETLDPPTVNMLPATPPAVAMALVPALEVTVADTEALLVWLLPIAADALPALSALNDMLFDAELPKATADAVLLFKATRVALIAAPSPLVNDGP